MGRAELQGKEREQYSWKSKKLDYTLVGKQIKKYRILKNLRQKDLAELVFATTNTISRIEIGNTGCSLELLLAISDVLEVSPDALLFGNFNPLYSRFYPYFWQMKEAIFRKVEESLQEGFREMEQKEALFSVEKDFHDWIARIGQTEKVAERPDAEELFGGNTPSEEEDPGKEGEYDDTGNSYFYSSLEAIPKSSEPEVENGEEGNEADKTQEWKAAIGGRKKKSSWLLDEWTKETRKKREEEERARRSGIREEIRKEKERIRRLEEETAEAKAKLAEKERREESFSYAADSFLFPKKELAESGKTEQEEGQKLKKEKVEKVQQRIRLKKTEE